jgi:thioredoxin-like negative regulator of GroEL
MGQTTQAHAEIESYLTYLQTHGHSEQGIKFIEELLVERPNDVILRRALAQLYHQAGRSEEAVAQLDTLAESMLSAGQKEEAMVLINQILMIGPPNADQYRQLLMQLQAG